MATAMEQTATTPTSAWLLLAVAILCEIGGAIGLRFSHGFTEFVPTLAALAAFVVALVLVSRVMKYLPVSVAYPVWAGGGTAGVAMIGITLLNEPLSNVKLAGIILVIVGVVFVNVVSEKRSGC